jgi:hypothetical protein
MMPSKMWNAMNDLELVTVKIVSAREIIDCATDAIQNNEYSRAETLMSAAYEFLGYYLDEFDKKFKDAWKETIVAQTSTVEKSNLKSWTLPVEFDEPTGEYFVQFPDELLGATGWQEGDELLWVDNKDGSFTLKKNEQNSN